MHQPGTQTGSQPMRSGTQKEGLHDREPDSVSLDNRRLEDCHWEAEREKKGIRGLGSRGRGVWSCTRRGATGPLWTSDQTHKAQSVHWHTGSWANPTPSPSLTPTCFQLCLPSSQKSSHIHSCSNHPSLPAACVGVSLHP